MGASTDPCGTPEVIVADEDVSPLGSPVLYGCSEIVSPIPASSLAYHSGGVWLPDGRGVLCEMHLRYQAAQRRSGHHR